MLDIKKLREAKGLKQIDLSRLTNIKQSLIAKYESEYKTMIRPKREYMARIAKVLALDVDDLMVDTRERKPAKKKECIKNKKCLNQVCLLNKNKKCNNIIVTNGKAPCHGEDRVSEPTVELSTVYNSNKLFSRKNSNDNKLMEV